ncbi:surfeit locus protein 1 [Cimex lectularius]|uniref:SURF1-like protein n=1 Tax=Cimex lectularius TaxID=79782 RepID=A0A8I6RMA9_CIMLE|nr:surfeit locus protein 1 [Cimex lectularius]
MNWIKCAISPLRRHAVCSRTQLVIYCQKQRLLNSEAMMKKEYPRPNLNLSSNKGIPLMGWFILLVPVGTFALGTWQVKRKKWKENLIEKITTKTNQPSIPLPADDSELEGLEYRKVIVTGTFDHSQEMYLGPRSCLVEGESKFNNKLVSSRSNNAAGYLVITPFILSDTKEKILVNRGWVPYSLKNPEKRKAGQIQEEVTLEGVLRVSEPPPSYMPLNKMDVRVWFARDVELMAETVQSRPVYIDATAESTVDGGPIGGQTRSSLRNEHLSYIFTWYALSGVTAYIWYIRFLK